MTESDGQNGQEIRALRLTVAQDGSGDYDTVGAALAAGPYLYKKGRVQRTAGN